MTKAKGVFAIVIALIVSCGTSVGQAPMIYIPLVDPDFESQTITGYVQTINDPAGCGTDEQGLIFGWTVKDLSVGPGRGVAHWTCDDGMPNSNVAFLQGAAMMQVLTETARPGVYLLQFDVANWFYPYPGNWNARMYQAHPDPNGDVVDMNGNRWTLSPAPFCNQSAWAFGDMKRQTVTCPLPPYLIYNGGDSLSVGGQVKGNIVIYFQNFSDPALGNHGGWPILIDNVSLSFSPQL